MRNMPFENVLKAFSFFKSPLHRRYLLIFQDHTTIQVPGVRSYITFDTVFAAVSSHSDSRVAITVLILSTFDN